MKKATKPKIIPRGKYMLVRPVAEEDRQNQHGLFIPSNVEQEQRAQGDVIAVSSEIKDVKVGDKVVFGAYAGEVLKTQEGGKEVEYKLLHDDDVIAFVK